MTLRTTAARADEAFSIDLLANPQNIRANGVTRATITAVVRGQNGGLVADGTPVSFQTTLGRLDTTLAITHAGRAQVSLTSTPIQGLAMVSAASGRASRDIEVAFLAPGEAAPETTVRVVVAEGDHVAYSADHQVIQASGNARIRVGSLEIRCANAQILVSQNVVVANGESGAMDLEMRSGGVKWKGDSVWYNWNSRQGWFAGELGGKSKVYQFVGPPLSVSKKEAPHPIALFNLADLSDTTFWITAHRAALFPGQRIQFTHAVIRPNGHRFVTLPYQSFPLSEGGPDADQVVGFGTHGFTLDVPFYLDLTDSSATSLRLGLNQQEGSLGSFSRGFGLDLRQTLYNGLHGEDTLDLSRITSSDFGAWFKHARQWSDRLQTDAFVQFPAHRDLLANASANWQLPNATATLNLNGSAIRGSGSSAFADLGLESLAEPLGRSGWLASMLTESSYSSGAGGGGFSQALEGRLLLPSLQIGRQSSLSASFTGGDLLLGAQQGLLADAVLALTHRFGRTIFLANYTFTQRPDIGGLLSPHRISANLITTSRTLKWNFAATGSLSLDGRSAAFSTDFAYGLNKLYRLGIRTTYVRAAGFPFTDYEFSLTRPLAGRDFTIYWSRQRGRIGIEFGSAIF